MNQVQLLDLAERAQQGRIISAGGNWGIRLIQYIFAPSRYYKNVTAFFISQLDSFERQAMQKEKAEAFLRAGEALLSKRSSSSLKQRIVALKYRAEVVKQKEADPVIYQKLEEQLKSWKAKKPFYSKEQKPLSARDLDVLKKVCCYEEFAKLLLEDGHLRDMLFCWSIRGNNQVEIFVEMPAVSQRLSSVLLAGRVGKFAGKILTMEKKDVFLRFQIEEEDKSLHSRKISILDESQFVTVRGGLKRSIRDIFEQFANKNKDLGDYEVFGEGLDTGIVGWNAHEIGYYSARRGEYVHHSFDDPEWWEKLPVFEVIEEPELEKRTGLKLAGKEAWGVVMARASRKIPKLDIIKCHGFLGFALRLEDGRYRIYDFGKYPVKFPDTALENLGFLANTIEAKMEYPDTSVFYSDRSIATHGEIVNQEQGLKLMSLIARDLKKARENKLVFQFCWENCAYWPQKIFNELLGDRVPNFYRMPLIRAEMSNAVLNLASRVAKLLPSRWQKKWIHFMMNLLQPQRGIEVEENGRQVKKSLKETPCMQGTHKEDLHNFYCPSLQHQLIEENVIQGVVAGGHECNVTVDYP